MRTDWLKKKTMVNWTNIFVNKYFSDQIFLQTNNAIARCELLSAHWKKQVTRNLDMRSQKTEKTSFTLTSRLY